MTRSTYPYDDRVPLYEELIFLWGGKAGGEHTKALTDKHARAVPSFTPHLDCLGKVEREMSIIMMLALGSP